MIKMSYAVVYNLSNITGVLLTSIGVGMFDVRYGLITAGVLVLGLNYVSIRMARVKQ